MLNHSSKRATGPSDCSKESEIHLLPSPRRTDGDGMENSLDAQPENLKETRSLLGKTYIYRPEDFQITSSPPPIITGKIVNLVPKHASSHKKSKSLGNFKPREPKFVPYEPYKAAVKPIIPLEKKKLKKEKKLTGRPPPDINEMIRKLSSVQVDEQSSLLTSTKDCNSLCTHTREQEMTSDALQKEIAQLKEDVVHLEAQLKFQSQVNGDLKTLLVAAVGEDLEIRVQHLTEDKLQLARALLSSAQVCTSHQERTEFLAGQCEVWRSKFLASSLMLEELASRKTSISLHVSALEEIIHKLLTEISTLRERTHNTYKSLSAIKDSLAPNEPRNSPAKFTALDLASACERLSVLLKSQTVGQQERREPALQLVDSRTEIDAKELLNSGVVLNQQDAASNAVMGAAIAVATRQTACCAHCSGEIKQV